MEKFIKTNEVGIIVIDSVAALIPRAELDGDFGDSKMGLHARLMSQAMRKLVGAIKTSNCIVIFINQLRMKIGVVFGSPETVTGGEALKFYSSIRVDVRRVGQEKDGDTVIANKTKIKVVKNKTAPPFRTAEFSIEFGVGINQFREVIDLGVQQEIIKKSGSWYSYEDTRLGQG